MLQSSTNPFLIGQRVKCIYADSTIEMGEQLNCMVEQGRVYTVRARGISEGRHWIKLAENNWYVFVERFAPYYPTIVSQIKEGKFLKKPNDPNHVTHL